MIRRLMLAVAPIVAGYASGAHCAVAVADRDRLWLAHSVPFVICETTIAASDVSAPATSGCDHGGAPLAAAEAIKVREAVAHWNDQFGAELRFVRVDKLSRSQRGVLFSRSKRENLCLTDRIGRPRTAHRTNVKLGPRCNGFAGAETPVGTVLHEMMHVAGFYHEQQRPDRDAYLHARVPHGFVKVLFDVNGASQWAKGGGLHPMRTLTPYDFGSIMHYPVADPNKAALTLEGLGRLEAQGLSMHDPGRRDAMSANDIAGVQELYGVQPPAASWANRKPLAKTDPAPL